MFFEGKNYNYKDKIDNSILLSLLLYLIQLTIISLIHNNSSFPEMDSNVSLKFFHILCIADD